MSFRQKFIVVLVALSIIAVSVFVSQAVASSSRTCYGDSTGAVVASGVSCRTAKSVAIKSADHIDSTQSRRAFSVHLNGRTWHCTKVTIKRGFTNWGCAAYVNGHIASVGIAVDLSSSGTQS